MLNEVPNNNDITRIANIVLNEVPNSNDTTHIVNIVHLATMSAHNNSQWQL